MRPVAFQIPIVDTPIYMWGLFVTLAFCICFFVAEIELPKRGIELDAAVLLLVTSSFGMFGAKVHYLWLNSDAPLFTMGFIWQGGAFSGIMALITYVKVFGGKNCDLMRVLDCGAPLVPLGHAIGKLGCFFSGDGCYGQKTNSVFGMAFPNGRLPAREPVHPTPLYEFITSMFIFWFLWKRRERALNYGENYKDIVVEEENYTFYPTNPANAINNNNSSMNTNSASENSNSNSASENNTDDNILGDGFMHQRVSGNNSADNNVSAQNMNNGPTFGNRKLRRGDQLSIMLLFTSLMRFLAEFFRDHDHDGEADLPHFFSFETNHQQRFALLCGLLGCVIRICVRGPDLLHWFRANKRQKIMLGGRGKLG